MSTVKENKNRFLTLGAIILLFASFWVYCSVRLAAPEIYGFIIECVFFIVLYALTLFDIPLVVALVLLIVGCVGRGYLYSVNTGAGDEDYLIPLTYFFAFLFYIEQLYIIKCGDTTLTKVISWISRTAPFVLVGWIFFVSYDEKELERYYLYLYSIVLSAIVGLVYFVISCIKQKQPVSKKKKKQAVVDEYKFIRPSFALAFVPVFASCLFLILNSTYSECVMYVLPVLWALNLILLCSKGHPLIGLSVDRISDKTFSRQEGAF